MLRSALMTFGESFTTDLEELNASDSDPKKRAEKIRELLHVCNEFDTAYSALLEQGYPVAMDEKLKEIVFLKNEVSNAVDQYGKE